MNPSFRSCFLAAATAASFLFAPALRAAPLPPAPPLHLGWHEVRHARHHGEGALARADRRLKQIGLEQGRAALDAFQAVEREQLHQELLGH